MGSRNPCSDALMFTEELPNQGATLRLSVPRGRPSQGARGQQCSLLQTQACLPPISGTFRMQKHKEHLFILLDISPKCTHAQYHRYPGKYILFINWSLNVYFAQVPKGGSSLSALGKTSHRKAWQIQAHMHNYITREAYVLSVPYTTQDFENFPPSWRECCPDRIWGSRVHLQGPAGIPVQVDGVEATGDVTVLLNLTAVRR
ncbi:hypothetical protein Celaphus_00011141, partial [Cervus elaphus hippelaphus]